MKFRVYRSSIMWHGKPCEGAFPMDWDPTTDVWYIIIDTLEELKVFQESLGHSIIVNFNPPRKLAGDCDGWIEIYDSYRE